MTHADRPARDREGALASPGGGRTPAAQPVHRADGGAPPSPGLRYRRGSQVPAAPAGDDSLGRPDANGSIAPGSGALPRMLGPTGTHDPDITDILPVVRAVRPPARHQLPTPAGTRIGARTASEAPPAIEAVGLRKLFKDFVAVDDVSLVVPTGSILALLGPNGAGKTTTVNMLCTLLKPDGGHAVVAGHDISKEAAQVRRSIALTGQFASLDESLTGRENLVLFGRLLGLKKKEAKLRATELLEHFNLVEAADKRVRDYSGGMRRRIDIACGLVTWPSVVFLDEPTTGLDPRSRQDVWSLIETLRDNGVTTLLTTQYLEEADMLADNIVVIDRGRVIAQGTANELKARTGNAYCDVTPEYATELPRLLATLADLLGPDHTQPPGLTVSVPAPDGADTLVEVVRRTADAGIQLADITLRRPSLDEVFLYLTDPNTAGKDAP